MNAEKLLRIEAYYKFGYLMSIAEALRKFEEIS
jgi:hypothetical protein